MSQDIQTDRWQVVEITGVGMGEMWFDVVKSTLPKYRAESLASREARHVAVPMSARADTAKVLEHEEPVDDYAPQPYLLQEEQ